jgi:replicative DNA helicase
MLPFERTLLRQLFGDTQFAERVMPYLKDKYFMSAEAELIFHLFNAFFVKFRCVPQVSVIRIGLDANQKVTEQEAKAAQAALNTVEVEPLLATTQAAWMLETTELWVRDRALYTALQEAVKIMDDPKIESGIIPTLMRDALAVSFDTHVGHDYFDDATNRYAFYHKPDTRLPFDLNTLNKLTNGGVPKKTLNVVLAGTNVGKSLALCHFAASYVACSKNVLYVTCEMAEEWIAQRIDGNLFNIPMDDVVLMPEADYLRKMAHLRSTSTGRLIIKEYPPSVAHAGMLRVLLQDLLLKQHFVPDVVCIDYLTICASEKIKFGDKSVNGFTFYKSVAEELRAFAVDAGVPVWTAAQLNREGHKSTDPGLEHVGESFGIVQTADFCVALVSSDDLDKLGQIALFDLKNRYGKRLSYQQHLLGIDTPRMKLYELNTAQVATTLSLPPNKPEHSSGGMLLTRTRRSTPMASLVDNANKDD